MEQQVVIITGAGSGIGRETAKLLATMGKALVLVDFDEKVDKTHYMLLRNITNKQFLSKLMFHKAMMSKICGRRKRNIWQD